MSCEDDEFDLDPKSALNREMYAWAGLTLYFAQTFEKGLANIISAGLFRAKSGKWTREEFEAEVDNLNKKTLGYLMRRFKDEVEIPEETLELISEAHMQRNFFVHNYFYERAAEVTYSQGHRIVIAELQKLKELFERADAATVALTKPLFDSIGLTDEKMMEYQKEIIDEAMARNQTYPKD